LKQGGDHQIAQFSFIQPPGFQYNPGRPQEQAFIAVYVYGAGVGLSCQVLGDHAGFAQGVNKSYLIIREEEIIKPMSVKAYVVLNPVAGQSDPDEIRAVFNRAMTRACGILICMKRQGKKTLKRLSQMHWKKIMIWPWLAAVTLMFLVSQMEWQVQKSR